MRGLYTDDSIVGKSDNRICDGRHKQSQGEPFDIAVQFSPPQETDALDDIKDHESGIGNR